jgi:hypothetical protein
VSQTGLQIEDMNPPPPLPGQQQQLQQLPPLHSIAIAGSSSSSCSSSLGGDPLHSTGAEAPKIAVICDIAADLQNLFEVWQEESSREPDVTWSMESASTEDDEPRRGWSKRGTIHKPGSRTSLRARGRGRGRGMAPLITWRKYRVRPRDNALYRAYMADPYWRKQK